MYQDRHKRIEKECEQCGNNFMAQVSRVKLGQGRFCSLRCANNWQRDEGAKGRGYDKGKRYWGGESWVVRWYDSDGIVHTTPYARWWWITNIGDVPNNYGISYKDGNPENINPNNLYMIELSEISRMNGKKSLGNPRPDVAGAKNKWWRGGSSYDGYPTEFSRPLKKRIKIRDEYTCQCCYSTFTSLALDVHHIDRSTYNNSEDNLVTVCKGCHLGIHEKNSKSNDRILYFRTLLS